jgi:hypothetical protein
MDVTMNQLLSSIDRLRLTALASILWRCFIITAVSLLFVWGVMLVAGDPIHRLHALAFDLSRREFALFVLGFLTFIKCLNVVLFLFPAIAITLYLRRQPNG